MDLQVFPDANYRFIIIDVEGCGKQSDMGTFCSPSLFNGLKNGSFHISPDTVLPSSDIVLPYGFFYQ